MTSQSDLVLQRARQLLQSKKPAEAIQLLGQHLDADSTDRDAWELLGICNYSARHYEAARDAFHQVTRMDPTAASAWVNLGAVQNLLHDHKNATNSLRKGIQKDKKNAVAYFNLGIAQKALGSTSMAVSAYKEAIRIDPDMPQPYANLANAYIEMKNLRQAVKIAEQGVEKCPNFKKIRLILQKAIGLKEGNQKAESPFGRLVDEKELARKKIRTGPRDLNIEQRINERTLLKSKAKVIRESTKPIVELLEHELPRQLHVLAMLASQKDVTGEGPEAHDGLLKSIREIERLRFEARKITSEIRTHLEATDPGLG